MKAIRFDNNIPETAGRSRLVLRNKTRIGMSTFRSSARAWRFANQAQGGKALEFVSEVATPRNTVTVELNRQPVEVLYAGPQPEYLGLDQINFKLPRNLKPGLYPMVIKIGDQMSNEVLLRVQ